MRVRTVTPLAGLWPVFNLTVEGAPEYYANGVLVHNCDTTRYMVAYLDDIKNAAPDSSHLVTDPLLERDNRPGLTLAEMEW